ncbi:MAG TPA: hypothetical protein VK734_13280 [Bradyrhizobium sp.]|jgi:hypothetical protein|nr:hypothetical protein [Bradyrhizobium sp.]
MTRRIGIAALAATLALSVSTAISPAVAAPAAGQKVTASGATDVSAIKHYRHSHYVYHPYYPYYLGRPYYYSPGPFFPFPSFVDDGWGSW